jgi:GNAT superfamily N-acetyltransferase
VPFVSEALHQHHLCAQFRSGKPVLDEWLARHALDAERRRTARTFVWHHEDGAVVAYYSLAAHLIIRDDLPRTIGRGNPAQIPALLLARLALDVTLHGQGHGGTLLAEAMSRAVLAAESAGARFVVVDAIDEDAARFYQHHGFRAIPDTRRLIQKVSDIAAALRS